MARSPSNSRSRSPVKRRRSETPAEPENACPFLIRLFVTKGRHTPMMEFEEGRLPIQDEFTAYGWKHSTPSSLIQLLLPSFPPPYRSPMARYSFRHIYVDASPRGLYRTKDLVTFTGRDLMDSVAASTSGTAKNEKSDSRHEGRGGLNMDMELDDVGSRQPGGKKIEEKTLEAYGFVTGDLISVSLHIPEPRGPLRRPTMGAVAGAPGSAGPGGATGDRGSFGWNGGAPSAPGGQNGAGQGAGAAGQADRTGAWERGKALPDQAAARPTNGRQFDGHGIGSSGGRWGRGGAQAGAGGAADRGGQRRSRSPDYGAGARRRSGSPENRRESWAARR